MKAYESPIAWQRKATDRREGGEERKVQKKRTIYVSVNFLFHKLRLNQKSV